MPLTNYELRITNYEFGHYSYFVLRLPAQAGIPYFILCDFVSLWQFFQLPVWILPG